MPIRPISKTAMASANGGREPADWVKLFGILANHGFRGYVSMEIETNDHPVPKFAAEEIRVARMFSGMPEPISIPAGSRVGLLPGEAGPILRSDSPMCVSAPCLAPLDQSRPMGMAAAIEHSTRPVDARETLRYGEAKRFGWLSRPLRAGRGRPRIADAVRGGPA